MFTVRNFIWEPQLGRHWFMGLRCMGPRFLCAVPPATCLHVPCNLAHCLRTLRPLRVTPDSWFRTLPLDLGLDLLPSTFWQWTCRLSLGPGHLPRIWRVRRTTWSADITGTLACPSPAVACWPSHRAFPVRPLGSGPRPRRSTASRLVLPRRPPSTTSSTAYTWSQALKACEPSSTWWHPVSVQQ